jgi:lysophospholipase L1-like esterase
MRVLVFGASVTQGFWDTEGGWTARLRRNYDELQVKDWSKDQPTVFNLGISGDGTVELLKRIENETVARKWPGEEFTFIISIGINDSFIRSNGKENISAQQYRENLSKIAEITKKYSSKIILLGLQHCDEERTTPVSWTDISYTNERILLFDKEIQDIASEHNLTYVPIFNELKKHHDGGQDLYQDGLHPNNQGHQLIFELVRPELDKLLARDANH